MTTQRTIDRMTEQAENWERREAEKMVEYEIIFELPAWLNWCKAQGLSPESDPEVISLFTLNDYLDYRLTDREFVEELNKRLE